MTKTDVARCPACGLPVVIFWDETERRPYCPICGYEWLWPWPWLKLTFESYASEQAVDVSAWHTTESR